MKSTVAAAILAIGAAAPSIAAPPNAAKAPQRDWYILAFNTNSCVSAKTMAARTPEQFHQALRNMGIVDDVHVFKDDAGGVRYVAITSTIPPSDNPSTLMWFPSAELCADGLKAAQDSGLMPDNSDLK
jgi:hypothetical protein